MPVNKNAITRFKVLDDLLSNRYHSYTIDDIVDEVNNHLIDLGIESVSRRCIEKDIAYLRGENSPFLADIESYSVDVYNGEKTVKKKCLRYKNPSFSIFKKEMSNDEAYLLTQTLSILGQIEGLPALEELNKLKIGLHPKDNRKIVSFTKNPLENSSLFGKLFTSITQKQVVRMEYHTLSNLTHISSLIFHPHLLKEYNRRWYVFGCVDDSEKILNFSLDQIDSIEPLPGQKYKPSSIDIERYFDDIIGVSLYENKPLETIIFWVSDRSKNYVATKPIHKSQIKYNIQSEQPLRKDFPGLEGGAFFSIKCKENYELVRELTSFGPELVVLSPNHLQETVLSRLSKMRDNYAKIKSLRNAEIE